MKKNSPLKLEYYQTKEFEAFYRNNRAEYKNIM